MSKRLFDLVAAIFGLLVLAPVLGVLAVIIKTTSPGPVFYRGRRVGRNGRPFRIFKFRTMVINADKIGGPSTSDVDPRITGVGRFMRKYKLDELPQLINVLLGEMSFVGPRPEVQQYVDMYTEEEKPILSIRPGITDWASIWNSDEGAVLAKHPDPDKAYEELIRPTKLKLQLLYAHRHNVWIDLKIIAYTAFKIVQRDWTPNEIKSFPKPGEDRSAGHDQGYETVTELPGAGATTEQLQMLETRYQIAGELAAGKDVLEVACGPGIGLEYLAARAKRVVGGDFDPKLVEIAKRRHGGRVEVQQFDAERLPFPDASFDTVLLLEAVYYLPNAQQFVRESRRVLRAGGTLLICSANCERHDFNPSPFSTKYYSARELKGLLEHGGFQAEVKAGFPIAARGAADHLRTALRQVAVTLHLIPKTMKWKVRLKRMFFGELKPLPTSLPRDLPSPVPLASVDSSIALGNYKVIYVIGKLVAKEQRLAA